MAIIVASLGIIQTLVGTEHVLTAINSAGVYVYTTDITSFVAGDHMTLRITEAMRSGDPLRLIYLASYANCQTTLLKASVPLVTAYQAQFTANCTSSGVSSSGAGSNGPQIIWRVLNVN